MASDKWTTNELPLDQIRRKREVAQLEYAALKAERDGSVDLARQLRERARDREREANDPNGRVEERK